MKITTQTCNHTNTSLSSLNYANQNIIYSRFTPNLFINNKLNYVNNEKEEFEITLDNITKKVDSNIHSFDGLGKWIGNLIGTRNDKEIDSQDNDYFEDEIEIENKSSSNYIENIKDFFSTSWNGLKHSVSEMFFPSPPLVSHDKSKEQAVVITSNQFYNSYKGQIGPFGKFLFDPSRKIHDQNLSKRFNFNFFKDIRSINQLCDVLEKAKTQFGPIKLLVIEGHGTPGLLYLSNEQKINSHDYFDANQKHPLSCLNDFLEPDASIVLNSCSTAGDNYYALDSMTNKFIKIDSKKVDENSVRMNIQDFFLVHAPGRTVLAPKDILAGGSLRIKLEPSFNADYRVSVELHEMISKLFKKDGIISVGLLYLIEKDYIVFFPTSIQRKIYKTIKQGLELPKADMDIISPENSSFCTKPISYYAMQKYCDSINKKPMGIDVKNCENNDKCNKTITLLQNLKR
jgi:hypothetical protein